MSAEATWAKAEASLIMAKKKTNANAYAVIATGGKQYFVKENYIVRVERLKAEVGEKVDIQPVLAISDGKKLQIGTPEVKNKKVTSSIVEHIRGKKVS